MIRTDTPGTHEPSSRSAQASKLGARGSVHPPPRSLTFSERSSSTENPSQATYALRAVTFSATNKDSSATTARNAPLKWKKYSWPGYKHIVASCVSPRYVRVSDKCVVSLFGGPLTL